MRAIGTVLAGVALFASGAALLLAIGCLLAFWLGVVVGGFTLVLG